MSLQGPIIVVADGRADDALDALAEAGVFPVVEARPSEAAAAIESVQPAAVVIAELPERPDATVASGIDRALAAMPGPLVPVVALAGGGAPLIPEALPLARDDVAMKLAARLRAALRVRTLHASVLRHAAALAEQNIAVPALPDDDPLADAIILVAGRGRNYPALTTAIGERMGLIGALSLDTARNYLEARDVDAVVIGDGFNRPMVETFVSALGADPRWRDLPVLVPYGAHCDIDPERMPNLDCVTGDAQAIAGHVEPFARLHAFMGRLKRMTVSLDQKGVLDPDTGLLAKDAFLHDFVRAIDDAESRGVPLSVARITLDLMASRRASLDAARIVGRLVRTADFACRDDDGTILVAFAETELATAHAVARRIASVLKHTTLISGPEPPVLSPTLALATFRDGDTVESLLTRVSADRLVAAG